MSTEPFDPGLALLDATEKVTSTWAKQRKAEERSTTSGRRRKTIWSSAGPTLKSVAWEVIPEAWAKASAGNSLPAHWRQVFYVARPLIQAEVTWETLTDSYFKRVFEEYVATHPGTTAAWKIIFGPRGSMKVPHGKRRVELGTIGVRSYLDEIHHHRVAPLDGFDPVPYIYPTRGPGDRYGALLVIEKEGFDEIFKAARLAERWDLAIANTKGVSTKASRELVETLSFQYRLPVLVAHDFDKNGFVLAGTLGHRVRSIGLRLQDVADYDLEPEEQTHRNPLAAHRNLRKNGASKDEADFISGGWRVELNMFASDQLVEWLESKLAEHGVSKVVPDQVTLAEAYRRAVAADYLNRHRTELAEGARAAAANVPIPGDLAARVRDVLDDDQSLTWDEALAYEIVGADAEDAVDAEEEDG